MEYQKQVVALCAAIVTSGLMSGGCYNVSAGSGVGGGDAVVINKFTGSIWVCNLYRCTPPTER